MNIYRLGFGLLILTAIGIGCSNSEKVTPVERAPKDVIRERLQQIIEGGAAAVGSGAGEIMQELAPLSEEDPALASSLENDARELMSAPPSKQKEIAQRMLDKLNAAGSGSSPASGGE